MVFRDKIVFTDQIGQFWNVLDLDGINPRVRVVCGIHPKLNTLLQSLITKVAYERIQEAAHQNQIIILEYFDIYSCFFLEPFVGCISVVSRQNLPNSIILENY